ncbi:MAG: threonine synthase [Trueperaceae bacterium]|nr:MAG: threonine synthase [Trueperaceae bacterium]
MSHFEKWCNACDTPVREEALFYCPACGGLLGFRYDLAGVAWDEAYAGSMWRYRTLLPVADPKHIVSLHEGGTPMVPARSYPKHNVFYKDEMRNPTGSHKDRPLAVALSHAKRLGASTSIVASTGSTGISNAALAARAGLNSVVVMTAGTPVERVYPMYALGSKIVEVVGDVDEMVDELIRVCRREGFYLSSTSRASNPYQGEGNKTIAFEIFEQLGRVPNWMVVTVGGGGTISGIWRGFKDLVDIGLTDRLPKMVGVVPKDYNALEIGFERSVSSWDEILAMPFHDLPPSILVKLAHPYPPDGADALAAVRESGGFFLGVSDDEALEAQFAIGRREGLYVEPSTSALLPAIDLLVERGELARDETLVALCCGSGFRETFTSAAIKPLETRTVAMDALPETLRAIA